MKKILVILLSLTVVLIFIPSFADAASITASISTQVGGVDVIQAVKGTTIQLVSSCIIDPSVPVTGTVSYQYSADGVIWTSKTTVTAYPSWDGAQQTTDFVLADSGSYIFTSMSPLKEHRPMQPPPNFTPPLEYSLPKSRQISYRSRLQSLLY